MISTDINQPGIVRALFRKWFYSRESPDQESPGEEVVPEIEPATDITAVEHTDQDTIGDFLVALFGDKNPDRVDLSRSESHLLEGLENSLASGDVINLVPRLSGSLPKLLMMLRDGTAVHQIGEQLASDPVLLASVIKIVNSPFYRIRQDDVDNINQAIVILGTRGLREVIASVTLRPILEANTIVGVDESLASSLWDEAIKCATCCRALARTRRIKDEFPLYLCGLTHGVGLTAVMRSMSMSIDPPSIPHGTKFHDAIKEIYPRMSAALIKEWEFPKASQKILREYARSAAKSRVASPELEILNDGIHIAHAHTLYSRGHYDQDQVKGILEITDGNRLWRTLEQQQAGTS